MRYCFSIKCETFPIPFFFASIIAFYAEKNSTGYKYNFLTAPGVSIISNRAFPWAEKVI